ncbi:MAG: AFG1 family ATPase [Alphaproteobacteria bacterium]|nr:AFG1 family ATPase [Alphaproteobacteria bacterium]
MSVADAYREALATGRARPDDDQARLVEKLNVLAKTLEARQQTRRSGWFSRFRRNSDGEMPRGLYIHGPVGRGKTMLMDLFFGAVHCAPKRRIHFHAFMQDVHARLAAARQSNGDPLAPVADAIAGDAQLLCLDEFQVTDIADAMILGRLFEALFARGLVLVATSNLAPSELYRDGLNRQLFLPFIALLERQLDIAALAGVTDYRLGRIKAHESFVAPLGPEADRRLREMWDLLTDSAEGETMELDLLGRKLHVPRAAHGCARFTFPELCEKPLGAPDYLAIARTFRTIFVSAIPALGPAKRNEAKRFIILIDTLYDAGCRLVASSAQPPEAIYPAGDHRLEFARTVSRLREMQSASWWGKKIAET